MAVSLLADNAKGNEYYFTELTIAVFYFIVHLREKLVLGFIDTSTHPDSVDRFVSAMEYSRENHHINHDAMLYYFNSLIALFCSAVHSRYQVKLNLIKLNWDI